MPDTETTVQGWARMNAKYAAQWPSIASKGQVPVDARQWDGALGKLRSVFQTGDPAFA